MLYKEFIYNLMEASIQVYPDKKKDYNQVYILAGGAGSGKSFISSHLVDFGASGVKIFCTDDIKKELMNSNKEKNSVMNKKFRKFQQMIQDYIKDDTTSLDIKKEYINYFKKDVEDLKKINDYNKRINNVYDLSDYNEKDTYLVSLVHYFILLYDYANIKNKAFENGIDKDSKYKPNILFDGSLNEITFFNDYCKNAIKLGYSPENIHLLWVLTPIELAQEYNKQRERSLDSNILINTHDKVITVMKSIIEDKNYNTKYFNGSIYIIFNNKNDNILLKNKKDDVVGIDKSNYICIKQPNKEIDNNKILDIKNKIKEYLKRK